MSEIPNTEMIIAFSQHLRIARDVNDASLVQRCERVLELVHAGQQHNAEQFFLGWNEHSDYRVREAKGFLQKAFRHSDMAAGKIRQVLQENVSGKNGVEDLVQRFHSAVSTMQVAHGRFSEPMYFQFPRRKASIEGARLKVESFVATEPVLRLRTLEAYEVWTKSKREIEEHFRREMEIGPDVPYLHANAG